MWGADLKVIRRFLRDPDGNIWSDAYLRHQFNDVQRDLQNRTGVLEEAVAQRVPDLYHCSYMFDWEWRHLPSAYSEFFQCLEHHDEYVFCHRWEPQQVTLIDADVTDDGVHFTQPWEAFMGQTPGTVIEMKFPKNLHNVKFMAYDEKPINRTSKKRVQSTNHSYITYQGTPIAWYPTEALDKTYVLYPRPATAFVEEVTGEGVAFYVEDDTEDTTVGTIAIRTGSSETGNVGAAVDIVGLTNNVFLVYDVEPQDVDSVSDESDFPVFLRKYIRYGVISRAYGANTDGKIPSLSELWGLRYEWGVKAIKRFLMNRRADRDYRFRTNDRVTRVRKRHPRLPDEYPAI